MTGVTSVFSQELVFSNILWRRNVAFLLKISLSLRRYSLSGLSCAYFPESNQIYAWRLLGLPGVAGLLLCVETSCCLSVAGLLLWSWDCLIPWFCRSPPFVETTWCPDALGLLFCWDRLVPLCCKGHALCWDCLIPQCCKPFNKTVLCPGVAGLLPNVETAWCHGDGDVLRLPGDLWLHVSLPCVVSAWCPGAGGPLPCVETVWCPGAAGLLPCVDTAVSAGLLPCVLVLRVPCLVLRLPSILVLQVSGLVWGLPEF